MVNTLKLHKRFLMKLLGHHKFYQEVYVKNGGNLYMYPFNPIYVKFVVPNKINFSSYYETIQKEIILLTEVDIITVDEANTLRNMIWHTADDDNVLIGMLLLKKYRKLLDKKLKDSTFESEFITNIVFNYHEKIYKTFMDIQLKLTKNKKYD